MASRQRWQERITAAYRNFPYAPPDYPGAPYRARLPKPPYAGAEGWKCSVYYYWWEYLRRHDGYKRTCERGGTGKYAALYKSFGDVHASSFTDWWWSHFHIFTFVSDAQRFSGKSQPHIEFPGVFLHVGYAKSKSEMMSSARDEIMKLRQRELNEELEKAIEFKPAARPVLKSLHQHLLAWDAKKLHPDLDDADLCDVAGLEVSLPYDPKEIAELKAEGAGVGDLERANRRAKMLTVQRHLRIAQQYIDNVVLGQFPLRKGR